MFEFLHPFLLGGYDTSPPSTFHDVRKLKRPVVISRRTRSFSSRPPVPSSPSSSDLSSLFKDERHVKNEKVEKSLPLPSHDSFLTKDGQDKDENIDWQKALPPLPPRRASLSTYVPQRIRQVSKILKMKWICCAQHRHAHINWYNQTDIIRCTFPWCKHLRCDNCKEATMPGEPKTIATRSEVKVKVRREPQEKQFQEGDKEQKKENVEIEKAPKREKGSVALVAEDGDLAKREEEGNAEDDGIEQADMPWASISPLSALEMAYLAHDEEEFDLSKLIFESWG